MEKTEKNLGLKRNNLTNQRFYKLPKLIIILTFTISCCFTTANVNAQSTKVSINLPQASIETILGKIEENTSYRFLYNQNLINTSKVVNGNFKNITVKEILDQIFSDQNVSFKLVENQIIISPSKPDGSKQKHRVAGTVRDASTNENLPGVNISIEGTSLGVTTDAHGKYAIEVPSANSKLLFSFVGYNTEKVQINGRGTIEVALTSAAKSIDEVVVVGYGTQKKSDATGSVTSVSAKNFNKGLSASPEQLINGKSAGVQILSANGEPGSSVSIRIRGTSSITASSEPLFVIDGVPVDNARPTSNLNASTDNGLNNGTLNPLVMLAPEDIENMTVLKDASATAIYGSRGANGVIIITTKKGAAGEAKVSYDGSFGIAFVPKKLDILSSGDYKDEVARKKLTASIGNASTDWQDEIFRTANLQSHNFAISGGSAKSQYRISLGTQQQQGSIIETDMSRYNARINATQKILNDLVSMQFNLAYSKYQSHNLVEQQTGGFRGGVINNAFKMDPTQPVYNTDGSFYEYSNEVRNPVALQRQVKDKTTGDRVIGNFETEISLLEGLKGKVNLAFDKDAQERKIYQPIASSIGKPVLGRAINNRAEFSSRLLECYLTYSRQISNHSISILGGYSWQEFDNGITNILGEGFSTDNLGYNSMEATGNRRVSVFNEANRLISYFARANYNFNNRYLITATLRSDGSSRFGNENQWGYFPSAALAWKVSNEEWIKDLSFINDLKIRVGYGITGNQEIGNYRYMSTLNVNQQGGAYFGGTYYTRYTANTIPNPKLQWEQTEQTNFGADFVFFKQRLYGSLDYYIKNTSKLLVELPAIQPSVSGVFLDNVGEMTNKGLEFTLGANIVEDEKFRWNVDFNIAKNVNEITKLYSGATLRTGQVSGAGAPGQGIQRLSEGRPFGTFWGYEYLGLDSNGAEMFKDLNNDGKIDDKDMGEIGHALPSATGGLSSNVKYQKWDFNVGLRFSIGNDIYNNTRAEISQPNRLPGQNLSREGADGKASAAYNYSSSRWIEDGSFLRLDNLTIGYNFSVKTIVNLNARFYITGQNLFVATKYKGFDPEVNTNAGNSSAASMGIDYNNYPKARTILLGASINF
jgi:iron complex outermembrane receptor protein